MMSVKKQKDPKGFKLMFAFDLPFIHFVDSKCLPAEQTIRVATKGWIVFGSNQLVA